MRSEIVTASELGEKVIDPLMELRYAGQREKYEQDLAAYEKAVTENHLEETDKEESPMDAFLRAHDGRPAIRGVYQIQNGHPVFVPRPREPSFAVFQAKRRERIQGIVYPASSYGLLAGALYNREIRVDRVERYETEMVSGKWVTLLSDPLTITEDGQVLNGQHRLAAATYVSEIGKWPNDPGFLVVWGVDPAEALYADGSSRTAVDERTIAVKLLAKAGSA